MRTWISMVALLALGGCDRTGEVDPDAAALDGALDASVRLDGASPRDAAQRDAMLPDGGLPDAAVGGTSARGRVVATRELVRERADDAPVADSESELRFEPDGGGVATDWSVLDSETGAVVASRSGATLLFRCEEGMRGAYDVSVETAGGGERAHYFERRLITCTLPRVAAGRRVIEVDLTEASYFANGRVAGVDVLPGDFIVVSGAISRSLAFLNLAGTAEAPIHIINEGLVTNTDTDKLLHLVNCRHVIVDGLGDDAHPYGFVLSNSGGGGQAVYVRNYTEGASTSHGSTGIELFGLHVTGVPGTAIQVDTGGSAAFQRDNWTFDGLRVHHNWVEDTGNEGFYLGYTRDWVSSVETHPAYQLVGAKVYRNRIERAGKDGIQVCNAVRDLEVHDNVVDGAGLDGDPNHLSSLQYNAGNEGWVYRNRLLGGAGINAQVGCTGGDSYFFANVIERASDAPEGSVVYLIADTAEDVSYGFFYNTVRARNAHFVSLNIDAPRCGSTARLDRLDVINNVVVLPDEQVRGRDAAVFRFDSARPFEPAITSTPNASAPESGRDAFCFADDSAGDYRPSCATSPAHDGTGVDVLEALGLTLSDLPGGVLVDADGRVLDMPTGHGAFPSE